jgi:hypothetical protein
MSAFEHAVQLAAPTLLIGLQAVNLCYASETLAGLI